MPRVQHFIVLFIDQCIQESIVTENSSSDAYGLMVDESTDVTITKKLVIYAKIVSHCRTKIYFVTNIDIADGRAETICVAVMIWVKDKKIILEYLLGFGSDSVSVMVDSKSGVATCLKA